MFLHHAIPAAVGAVALFAQSANTHMIMNLPIPYGFTTAPMVEVSPLDGIAYKYPCQGLYNSEGAVTNVEAGGAPTLVQFTGTAAHGGGSCQFSISYDDPEAAGGWNSSATFKTIYTLIGGCPVSATGNLAYHGNDARGRSDGMHCGNDTGKECVRQFLIPFPKFLKNGRATFSWTWHNKLGNREIYQNCAAINITGGTGDQAQIDALPKIFLGDLPAVQSDIPDHTSCSLAQNQVVNYPNPGKYGRVLEPPTDPTNGKPDGYCSDVPPASALPTFEEDSRTIPGGSVDPTQVTNSATYEQTPSAPGSLFITIPTDTAAGTPSTTAGGYTNPGAPTIGTTTGTGTTATTSSTKKSCGKPGSVLPTPSSPSGRATGLSSSSQATTSEVDATETTDSTEQPVTKTLTSTVTVMAHTVTLTPYRGCVPQSSSSSSSSTSTTQATSTVDGYGGGAGGTTLPGTTTSTSTTSTEGDGYGGPGVGGNSGTTTPGAAPSPSSPSSSLPTLISNSTTTLTTTRVSTVTLNSPPATAKGTTTINTPATAMGTTTILTTGTPSASSTTTYMSAPTMPPVDSASYDHSYLQPCTSTSDGASDEGCWHF